MRLLFVSHSFPPVDRPLANVGGMQRVATELFEAFGHMEDVERHGHLLRTSWRMTHARIPLFLWRTRQRLRQVARDRSVDVVLFSSMVTAAAAAWVQPALRQSGIRTAAIVHGQDVTTPFGPYQRFVPRVFDALDAVLPVSRATGAQCTERGLPDAKLHVVPNGVKLDRFAPLTSRPAMRAELVRALGDPAHPLPESALLLCSVGRQVKRKGFAWFVEQVMPALPPDVHYWLAGDGPETPAIQAAAARLGLGDRVRLLGRVSDADLMRLYRGADLFVMPNIPVPGTMEGFGVVMLEAGISGLPAIAARLEGIQDVVAEGENGHFVESGDAGGFIEAILRYDRDRHALARASERAAAYTRETFSWEAVARRYVDVLGQLSTVAS
ncbi:MAG: glycosyltransferase family 4 protein [Rhodothermales bacterium]